jgi:hypothetical protein
MRIEKNINGPRFYLLGRRIHHFLTGICLTIVGVAFIWHDRKDWKQAFGGKEL